MTITVDGKTAHLTFAFETTDNGEQMMGGNAIHVISAKLGNEVITLVKDTSLCFVLALAEMFTIVKQIVAAQVSMVPFILAALVYWGFTMLVEFLLGRVEKHFDYYHD